MNTPDPNEVSKKVEALFSVSNDEGGDMWQTFSQFAAQFDMPQILGILRLEFIANSCSDISENPNSPKPKLLAFIQSYKALCNNRGTLIALLKMAEMAALKHYFTGITGQVKIDK